MQKIILSVKEKYDMSELRIRSVTLALEKKATENQKWLAHQNALDTTKSLDSEGYFDCFWATLELILDAPEQYSM